MSPDICIRNTYALGYDDPVDIAIADGRIESITVSVHGTADTEIDGEGCFVSPGFVDTHMHLDKSFAIDGERLPKFNDDPWEMDTIVRLGKEYFQNMSTEALTKNAIKNARMAAANGTTHLRSHVTIDEVSGTKTAEAVLNARDAVSDLVEVEVVPYSEMGVLENPEIRNYLSEALEMGADLLGGMDPLSLDNDIDTVLDHWFELAATHNVDIDCHIHESGTLGQYTIRRISEKTIEHGYEGRVTISHAFALSEASEKVLSDILPQLREAGINLITCSTSTRQTMPVRRLLDDDEICIGHGTDNTCDFVLPYESPNVLNGLRLESRVLAGDPAETSAYRYFDTNDGLADLWTLATTESAKILDIEDYGLKEKYNADLVMFREPSLQWVVLRQPDPAYVIKNGSIIARDGELVE